MANIGFIGLGMMGKLMAETLIKGGHSLFLHSRSVECRRFFTEGCSAICLYWGMLNCKIQYLTESMNKAPRRKQRGIKSAFQAAGFQPAFAPRGEELNPKRD